MNCGHSLSLPLFFFATNYMILFIYCSFCDLRLLKHSCSWLINIYLQYFMSNCKYWEKVFRNSFDSKIKWMAHKNHEKRFYWLALCQSFNSIEIQVFGKLTRQDSKKKKNLYNHSVSCVQFDGVVNVVCIIEYVNERVWLCVCQYLVANVNFISHSVDACVCVCPRLY